MIVLTTNSRTVLNALDRLADSLTPSGMRPVMMEIGEDLLDSTRERFKTSTAPDGSVWPELSEKTVLARMNKTGKGLRSGTGTKPLVDTGQLSSTIRYQIADGGASVVIGTNRSFGAYNSSIHQYGTSRAGRKRNVTIPARPFLGLSAEDERTVLDIIVKHLSRT